MLNKIAALKLALLVWGVVGCSSEQLSYADGEWEALESIAENERSGRYRPGLGLVESTIREREGDHAGAVIAAFKDLCWAYGFDDSGAMSTASMKEGLGKVRELYTDTKRKKTDAAESRRAIAAVDSAIAFLDRDFVQARKLLDKLFRNEDADSFVSWMKLVCMLEEGDRTPASTYSAIRARWELFPAYWYYAARNMSTPFAADYAERCIDIVPNGTYAGEARNILARISGLQEEDGSAMRSKREIESIIREAVNTDTPAILAPLLPLVALNDNPYTLYAFGAMQALASQDLFRAWFEANKNDALKGGGNKKLAERLALIVQS